MDNKKMAAVLLGIFLAAGTLEGCGSGQPVKIRLRHHPKAAAEAA